MFTRICSFLQGVALVGLGMAWTACGGTASPDSFYEAFYAAYCERLFTCCSSESLEKFNDNALLEFHDVDSCAEAYTSFVQAARAQYGADDAVTSGRVRFDADVASACVASVQDASCDVVNSSSETGSCAEEVFVGQVVEGGACHGVRECAAGYCDGGGSVTQNGEGDAAEVTWGTCKAMPAVGEACGPSGECAVGLGCAFDQETLEASCQVPQPNGGECDLAAVCASDALCDYAVTPAICTALPGPDEACLHGVTCADGLYCRADDHSCQPQRSQGEECHYDDECMGGSCAGAEPSEEVAGTCASEYGMCSF